MTYTRILSNLFKKSQKLPILAVTALSVIIAGCSSPQTSSIPSTRPVTITPDTSVRSVEQTLAEASRSTYPRRAELTLSATNFLLETDSERAGELLNNLPYDELSQDLQARLAMQQARIAEKNGQNWEVFHWLDREPVITSKDPELLARAHILRAQTYSRFGEHLAALDEWLTGLPMLYRNERTQYEDSFWQSLLHTPASRLQELHAQTRSSDMKGWLALALIYQPGTPLDEQLDNLRDWQSQWHGHPASAYLPENFAALQGSAMQRPEKVAVLLPLNGQLAKAGQSVRDGMIAAYYDASAKDELVPELTFYDTSSKDINQITHQAIDQGAELIIGPLTKSNVKRLESDATARIPVLALNYIDENNSEPVTYRPHFYQFGLSAEDEARMAAHRGWTDGHRRAVVIAPETEWGKKISHTFIETWLKLGGEVASATEFPAKTEFSQLTGKILQTDQSQTRARQLSRQLGHSVGFQPRRRQDVDMIFIGANPTEARQIKPALAYQFAGSVPVYATSSAFSGTTNRSRDQDMNGVRLPVMPWLVPNTQYPIEKKITKTWPQALGQYGTLYALGADAFRLYPRLQQLHTLQGSQVSGLTGSLSISPQGKVQRELTWQLFRNGRLAPLPVTRPRLSYSGTTSFDTILSDHALAAQTIQP